MQILSDKILNGLMTADYDGDISRVTLADEHQCCGIMVKLSVDSQWKVIVDISGGHEVKEHYKPGRHRGRGAETGERTSTFSSGSIYEIVQDTEEDGLRST